MRCHKAKAKIDQGDRTDAELLAHLTTCPSCARLASAQEILDSAARSVKSQASDTPTDLALLRAALAARQKSKEPITMLKHAITSHPRLGIGLAVFVFAVLLLTLVPLPYQRISGYNVSSAAVEGDIPIDQLTKALTALGYANIPVDVTKNDKGTSYHLSDVPSLQVAKEVAAALDALTKAQANAKISPNIETVSASLYAQLAKRMVQIEINGDGKSDEEIKAEIEAKLAAQGISGPLVYVKTATGPDGKKQINLKIEESGNQPPEHQATIEVDPRGKTDAQIKAEVEAKLAAQGHPNAQVNIHSEGADSTRKVEIRIEDIDTTGH